MTETRIPTESPEVLAIVPVRVVETERGQAADFGAWSTYDDLTTIIRVLPQSPHRHRAVLIVSGAVGDTVTFGSFGQVDNGRGGLVPAGTTIVLESASEVWAIGTATAVLTVCDERYAV